MPANGSKSLPQREINKALFSLIIQPSNYLRGFAQRLVPQKKGLGGLLQSSTDVTPSEVTYRCPDTVLHPFLLPSHLQAGSAGTDVCLKVDEVDFPVQVPCFISSVLISY